MSHLGDFLRCDVHCCNCTLLLPFCSLAQLYQGAVRWVIAYCPHCAHATPFPLEEEKTA